MAHDILTLVTKFNQYVLMIKIIYLKYFKIKLVHLIGQ